MTSKQRALPMIRVTATENRTPTGRRSAVSARKATAYFAFGNERKDRQSEEQRGEWYGPDGATHEHETVVTWAAEQAKAHRYTFQALLSVPEGRLRPLDYCRALAAGGSEQIDEWRMVAHDDTDYSHAHVLFFRDQRIQKDQYLEWRARVQEELAALEQKQLDGQLLDHGVGRRQEGGIEL